MGPVIFITGNSLNEKSTLRKDLASMGPVIFITGNILGVLLRHPPPRFASMGPVIFITGNEPELVTS